MPATRMTAEEYVVKELLNTKEELAKTKQRVDTLQEDVDGFCEDFLRIRDHFKVETNSTKTELKIVFYEDPNEKYAIGDTLCFSGSLEVSKFSAKFRLIASLLKLTDIAEDLAAETIMDLNAE